MYGWLTKARDVTWQKRMEDQYKGKQQPAGQETKPGTFKSNNPGQIAKDLKDHSKDRKQATNKLNLYVNRTGRNLNKYGKKNVMDQAKKALDNAYGVDKKKEADASPIAMPVGVPINKDLPMLKIGAARRLRVAGIQNSVMDDTSSTYQGSVIKPKKKKRAAT